MKYLSLLIIFVFINSSVFSQEEFSGTINFNGTYWVRMMGYPPTVPKWIKITFGAIGTSGTQSQGHGGSSYHYNLNGVMGATLPNPPVGPLYTIVSTFARDAQAGYKLQVVTVKDPRYQGKDVKPIEHTLWEIYNPNRDITVPMSDEYVAIFDLVGGGAHYNYLKSLTTSTEIIMYDERRFSSGATYNAGLFDSFGSWISGTPIITNWKGVNAPNSTQDFYETDPKYEKYKNPTYHDPVDSRKDDGFGVVPKPNRLGDGDNDILGDLANITDVEGCINLNPLETVTWNVNAYINDVNDAFTQKFDLTFFDSTVTERSLPDFSFEVNILEEPQTFDIVTEGKLNAGSQTEALDNFFSIARSIVLIFISLYAITHLFAILRR